MTPVVFRAVTATAALGIVAGITWLMIREARRDRRMHQEDEAERETRWRMKTGISDEDEAEFRAIVARYYGRASLDDLLGRIERDQQ